MCKFNEMIGEGRKNEPVLVITGALGFIGSCFAAKSGMSEQYNLVIVDDFNAAHKNKNIENISNVQKVGRKDFFNWVKTIDTNKIVYIIHIGARTNTSEFRTNIFDELNLNYSKNIWNFCAEKQIPLI